MVDTQHDQGRAESPTAAPGTHNETAHTEQPTVHEFLTQLATDPAARSAFIADPQATLDQAGLGDLTATDVLQATSLVLDYAPVEVVTEYSRSLQSSIDQFATSTQHVAINHLHPAHSLEQEELSMLKNNPEQNADFGKGGDVDEQLPEVTNNTTEISIEKNDSGNLISAHDLVSDTNVNLGGVTETVDNTVDSAVDTVDGALSGVSSLTNNVTKIGIEANDSNNLISAHDLISGNEVNVDLANTVNAIGGVVGGVGETATGLVGDVTDTVDHTVDTAAGIAGGAGTIVGGTVNNVVDGLL